MHPTNQPTNCLTVRKTRQDVPYKQPQGLFSCQESHRHHQSSVYPAVICDFQSPRHPVIPPEVWCFQWVFLGGDQIISSQVFGCLGSESKGHDLNLTSLFQDNMSLRCHSKLFPGIFGIFFWRITIRRYVWPWGKIIRSDSPKRMDEFDAFKNFDFHDKYQINSPSEKFHAIYLNDKNLCRHSRRLWICNSY